MQFKKILTSFCTLLVVMTLCFFLGSCATNSKASDPVTTGERDMEDTTVIPEKPAVAPAEPGTTSTTTTDEKKDLLDLKDKEESTASGMRAEETDLDSLELEMLDDSVIPEPPIEGEKETYTDVPSSSGLKAGFADDNKQFNYFINFLKEYDYVDHFNLFIEERIILKISDSAGNSLPGAEIKIFDTEGWLLCRGRSYADGTFLFFPSEYTGRDRFPAEISFQQNKQELTIDRYGKRVLDIVFDLERPVYQDVPLDILFIMDTTGSMGEEIERLRTTLEIININLVSLSSQPRVRFGMVLYKDRGDDEEYITQIIPFTTDVELFQEELDAVYADGGGDYPEDLQSALEDALKKINWTSNGIKLGFIITDAPPHLDYGQEYTYIDAVHDAREEGIKIFSVGTGGLDVYGEYILRQISQYTYAKYIFLTYGEKSESSGGIPGSVSHHTGSNFQTDKLESIIIRFAKEELSQLTDQPLDEGEEYFQAVKIQTENNAETLRKLFDLAINQLIDYSSINIPMGTRASILPVIATDEAYNLDAEYFTDQLIDSLAANRIFTMVERKDIQSVLDELKLQFSGLVNDASAVQVGAFLGAEMLISGKLYIKDDNFEMFLKLLRVETAEVLGVTKARITHDLGLSN